VFPYGVVDINDLRLGHKVQDKLRDAVALLEHDGLITEIRHDHSDLATVRSVYRTRCVEDGELGLRSQPASRSHLCLDQEVLPKIANEVRVVDDLGAPRRGYA
jgi:hypothetical protein